ncbi:MAG: hypothetical protein ABR518_00930 [Actinomycetota bacterium]
MRRLSDERGVAMVTALLVSIVVASLGIVVVQLSAHNAGTSAFDRKRIQAIDAAEAGINAKFSAMRDQTGSALCSPTDADLPLTPGAHYHVTVELFATWPPSGAPLACPPPENPPPAAAKITSVGTAVSPGSTVAVSRTMQTEVRLSALYPQTAFGVFSDQGLNFQNKLTMNGNVGNDANAYTNGNFTMANNTVIGGSVFAQGTSSVTNGVVKGDIWSGGSNTIRSVTVFGSLTSSTGNVTLQNNSHVYRDAKAGGVVSVDGSSEVDGVKIEHANLGPPPQIPFPQVPYNPTAWQNAGYTIRPDYTDCNAAKSAIMAGGSAGQSLLFHITSTCTLTFGNDDAVTVRGNLAILTDGGFLTQNRVTFQGTSPYKLYVISPWRDGLNCSTIDPVSGRPAHDLNFSNQTAINSLSLFAYSPCTLNYGNNNASGSAGQLIGRQVNITNQLIFNYRPVLVPDIVVGYGVEIAYLREIENAA